MCVQKLHKTWGEHAVYTAQQENNSWTTSLCMMGCWVKRLLPLVLQTWVLSVISSVSWGAGVWHSSIVLPTSTAVLVAAFLVSFIKLVQGFLLSPWHLGCFFRKKLPAVHRGADASLVSLANWLPACFVSSALLATLSQTMPHCFGFLLPVFLHCVKPNCTSEGPFPEWGQSTPAPLHVASLLPHMQLCQCVYMTLKKTKLLG